jgi:mono/diheme cytochrome c family protein
MMRQLWLLALPIYILSAQVHAQSALTPRQQEGQKILMTSCGLCHEKPDILNPAVAPHLSRSTLGGHVDDIIAYIKTGSNVMPSFKYMYNDEQLRSVADYIISRPDEATEGHKANDKK